MSNETKEEAVSLLEEIWDTKQALQLMEESLQTEKKRVAAAGKKLEKLKEELKAANQELASLKEELKAAEERGRAYENRALNAEALYDCYRRGLSVTDEIRSMKFARAYTVLSRRAGKGDPFDSVRPEIPNFSGIDVHIESRRYLHGKVMVRGWAADRDAHAEFLMAADQEGRRMEADIERHVRKDVNDSLHLENERKTGFTIMIPDNGKENLPVNLICESPKGYVVCPLRLEADQNRRVERWRKVLQGREKADPGEFLAYNDWAAMNRISREELEAQGSERFRTEVLFSVVIPLYNTPRQYLEAVLDSILEQSYRHLEVCLADGSTEDGPGQVIHERYGSDPRVKYRRLSNNRGISGNTNEAISMAEGDFLILADHDDILEPHALFRMAEALIRDPEADILYTDEDKVTEDGEYYYDPFLKPDFDPDLLRSYNYFTHLVAVRRSLAEEAGYLDSEYDGAQDYDFFLRCTEKAGHICHIPEILYHWRAHETSTAGNPESKLYAYENGRKAVAAHLERIGTAGDVQMTPWWGRYRVSYRIPEETSVSVILWGEGDKAGKYLKEHPIRFVSEILSAEPGKDTPEALNKAAWNASGDRLLFWSRDTAPVDAGAVDELLGLMAAGADAAGTKLSDPNGRLYHAGYTVSGGECSWLLNGIHRDVFAYGGSANLIRGIAAVSADFMIVDAGAFRKAAGFSEHYKEELFDADLCLRIMSQGGRVVFTPYAAAEADRGDAEERLLVERSRQKEDKTLLSDRKIFSEEWESYSDPFYHKLFDHTRLDFSLSGQYGPEVR